MSPGDYPVPARGGSDVEVGGVVAVHVVVRVDVGVVVAVDVVVRVDARVGVVVAVHVVVGVDARVVVRPDLGVGVGLGAGVGVVERAVHVVRAVGVATGGERATVADVHVATDVGAGGVAGAEARG